MVRLAALLVLAAVAGPALGQDALTQDLYASMEGSVRREYDGLMQAIARGEGGPRAGSEKMQQLLKVLYHNKAVLFASCAAQAERVRSPQAARVPAGQNLMLTTCVEEKFAELNKFSNVRSYALAFFPDRIERCGEASRLRDQEPLFPPYGFLQLPEPRLYDFTRYNECLMRPESTSPAAQ
ncbi:MAG: hypothetical protein K2Z80_13305 [Xanthobacteraceae bacterium]|nr:hypothetical protein [Xanthobacteraceae bacterium]